jgi:BirA family biotin operon repressor/biotin-[acetyl-CoA-carboxylase] ligase
LSLSDPPDRPEPLPAALAAALAHARSRLGAFARDVHWHAVVPSTNDLAATQADRGAAEGTVVIAAAQSAGRGRHRRAWSSPAGAGLYVSVVLRPERQVVPLLTIAAGVAVAEGIRAATGLSAQLKWPNDVYVGPRKLAGILTECSSSGSSDVQSCVLGFGINVREAPLPAEIAARATSIEGELGRGVDVPALLVECLAALAARYDDLRRGNSAVVLEAWRRSAQPLLGRAVEWDNGAGVRRGTAEDVDASGALLVRTDEGTARVTSGEVRWI